MLKHVMLDIETWGTGSYSTIIQIGACHFDPYVQPSEEIIQVDRIILDKFEVSIDPERCQGMSRIDPATILWWISPNQTDARTLWLAKSKLSLAEALDGFTDWLRSIGERKDLRVWGNGSDFDNTLVLQAYGLLARELPWSFRHNRCFRTLKNLAPFEKIALVAGTAHTALGDATSQAIHANAIGRLLRLQLT